MIFPTYISFENKNSFGCEGKRDNTLSADCSDDVTVRLALCQHLPLPFVEGCSIRTLLITETILKIVISMRAGKSIGFQYLMLADFQVFHDHSPYTLPHGLRFVSSCVLTGSFILCLPGCCLDPLPFRSSFFELFNLIVIKILILEVFDGLLVSREGASFGRVLS